MGKLISKYKFFSKDKCILVTGGCGFIGSALIRRLIEFSESKIVNIDKLTYASDSSSIKNILKKLNEDAKERYQLFECDLYNKDLVSRIISETKPDYIYHFAAESHVDRSINDPISFINSNIIGTYNLLESAKNYYQVLSSKKKNNFKFHHISTDEVFGSLTKNSSPFNENSQYDPSSPYSASKASSDHLVNAWHKTYDLPILISNCSNNYGPWQFPEKLIPNIINLGLQDKNIPIYGNGQNIRDWLFVEDHIDALLLMAGKAKTGKSYCIGSGTQINNLKLCELICKKLDKLRPKNNSYKKQIIFVEDRPGHDLRYEINYSLIKKELGWHPKHSFSKGLDRTIRWYLDNIEWLNKIKQKSGFTEERLGRLKANEK